MTKVLGYSLSENEKLVLLDLYNNHTLVINAPISIALQSLRENGLVHGKQLTDYGWSVAEELVQQEEFDKLG